MTLIAFARKDGFEVFTHPHRVGDDRKAKGREAGQIAVHADDDIGDLRREPRDDMREQRHAGKLNDALSAPPMRLALPPARMTLPAPIRPFLSHFFLKFHFLKTLLLSLRNTWLGNAVHH
jgi:hypothetical protein